MRNYPFQPIIRKNKIKTDRGYILIWSPNHPNKRRDGYIFEHRLIMENIKDRQLLPYEYVHHINGIKNDNRPENLVLLSQKNHQKKHDAGKWAKKFENCRFCHTQKFKHVSNGACLSCYRKIKRIKRLKKCEICNTSKITFIFRICLNCQNKISHY